MPIPPCEKRSNRRIISKNSSKYRDPKVGLTSSHGNFKGNSSKALHFLGTASREFPMEGKKATETWRSFRGYFYHVSLLPGFLVSFSLKLTFSHLRMDDWKLTFPLFSGANC